MEKQKIVVTYYNEEGGVDEELLWVLKAKNGYIIDNIPFISHNLSYQDVVSVELDDSRLYYYDLVSESGNSTIQIVFLKELKPKEELLIMKKLEALGCEWEGFEGGKLYTISVMKNIQYRSITNLLDEYSVDNIIDYKEACISTNHKEQK